VSDFHLGAGHRNRDGTLNILEDFFHDREFIEFLQHFGSKDYEDFEIELILNGDFFNLLQIDFDEIDADILSELTILRRMRRILDGHRATMNALKFFQSLPGRSVAYVMGNHDPGILFPSVQDLVRESTGEKTRFFIESYAFDGIYVEHGNQYEAANRFERDHYFLTKNIPEPLLNQPWGTVFLVHVVNKIKRRKPHFDKVLPFSDYLKWLLVYDFRFGLSVIFDIVRFFFRSNFKGDLRRNNSLKRSFSILKEAPVFPDLDQAAARILAVRDDIHTVIFGHNHRPTFRQFSPGKEYLNTGTWNSMTHLEIDRLGTRLDCTFVLIDIAVGVRERVSRFGEGDVRSLEKWTSPRRSETVA